MREERDSTTAVVLIATFGALAVACCGCGLPFAAIAVPNFVEMQFRAKRAEVPSNVDGIKTAQLAYHAAFDTYVEVPRTPRGRPGKAAVVWAPAPAWQELGWAPDGAVRGVYWVDVSADGSDFTVHGLSDVDGDFVQAEYTATKSVNATFLSRNDTY